MDPVLKTKFNKSFYLRKGATKGKIESEGNVQSNLGKFIMDMAPMDKTASFLSNSDLNAENVQTNDYICDGVIHHDKIVNYMDYFNEATMPNSFGLKKTTNKFPTLGDSEYSNTYKTLQQRSISKDSSQNKTISNFSKYHLIEDRKMKEMKKLAKELEKHSMKNRNRNHSNKDILETKTKEKHLSNYNRNPYIIGAVKRNPGNFENQPLKSPYGVIADKLRNKRSKVFKLAEYQKKNNDRNNPTPPRKGKVQSKLNKSSTMTYTENESGWGNIKDFKKIALNTFYGHYCGDKTFLQKMSVKKDKLYNEIQKQIKANDESSQSVHN